MFDDKAPYERVKAADILTNEMVKRLYQVEDEQIITNMYFDPAMAWKCTIKRPWAQGSVGERDTLGTQQHAPLLSLPVPAAGSATNGVKTALTNSTPLTNGHSPEAANNVNGVNGVTSTSDMPDRTSFEPKDSVKHLLTGMGLPEDALNSLHLEGSGLGLPSSFKIGHLAQTSIALSALTAALVHSLRNKSAVPEVTVDLLHAAVEFKSERLYKLGDQVTPSPWGPIGGLHKTADGYVRIHDSFPNHRDGALALLGCDKSATREQVAEKAIEWNAIDLEQAAFQSKIVISAVRSYKQWDLLPQAKILPNFPITIRKIADGPPGLPSRMTGGNDKCLRGLRVLELSRVIAAPLAGKTLAAHGADVLWVTSPNLPDLPTMDRDFGRGKRTTQLDLKNESDVEKFRELAKTSDIFIQGYRPGSVAARELDPESLAKINPGIICGNMSGYGADGPWGKNRGFDSLVQTCSGMNVSEAEHFGAGEPAKPTPSQALDHAGGYFLAAGVTAALYLRGTQGGSYEVSVSLAGTMKYLRSLGQFPGKSGFDCKDPTKPEEVMEFLETHKSGFGALTAVAHSAKVKGAMPGWEIMPKPLGSDGPEWLQV